MEYHHHRFTFAKPVLQLQHACDRGTRRVSDPDTLLPDDLPGKDRGIPVSDLLEVVDNREVHVLRQKIFADTFRHVGIDFVLVELAGLLVFLENGTVGIDTPYLYVWVFLLQVAAGTGDRTASANADDQVIYLALRLLPELGARTFVVSLRVAQIVVLVGFPGVRRFLFQPG